MDRRFFMALSVFAFPAVAFAYGMGDFEFVPKVSSPLNIIDQPELVYEIFFPQNDHLSGLDLWVDNEGLPGEVSFGLRRDGVDTLLTSKTITATNTPMSTTGTKLHIDFGELISVIGNQKYSLKILSETPAFRVYKAPSAG